MQGTEIRLGLEQNGIEVGSGGSSRRAAAFFRGFIFRSTPPQGWGFDCQTMGENSSVEEEKQCLPEVEDGKAAQARGVVVGRTPAADSDQVVGLEIVEGISAAPRSGWLGVSAPGPAAPGIPVPLPDSLRPDRTLQVNLRILPES